jgi:hypothetical protein
MRRDQLEHAIRTACHAGELSPFEELHGFSIDGVDLETSALPAGWCLDKEDLCVAKLCAFREKTRTSSQPSSGPHSSTTRPSSPGWPP